MTYRFVACEAGTEIDPDGDFIEAGISDRDGFRAVLAKVLAYGRADARPLLVAV
ncbi:hypothetical protein [Streptomyces sp. NPDC051214]|uniref:hypothetical protein n=1 Tax=Streptomyces sp. NPDC051214 TaxID=3155282 RepID=UPI003434BAFB